MIQRFQIGETERHVVSVKTNLITKYITIEVDDVSVISDWHPSPFAKKFHLEVGSPETHQVDVNTGMLSPTRVLVDGKPVPPIP